MQGEGGFWGRDLPHWTPISQSAAHSAKETRRAGDSVTFSEPLRIIAAASRRAFQQQHIPTAALGQRFAWLEFNAASFRFIFKAWLLLILRCCWGRGAWPGWLGFGRQQNGRPTSLPARRAQKAPQMCFSIPAATGNVPFTSGLPWEPGEGKPGLYWRKPHFQHLAKVSTGAFVFHHRHPPPPQIKRGPSRSSPHSLQSSALLNHPASAPRA